MRYGLTCNSVRAFEVVLASGERLRVDADHEPELFWALRGGGGRFAVVTALELEAHPVPEASAGMLAWPAERAAEVLEQFRRWTWDVPEALGAVFRYLALPDVDGVPAPLRGRRIVAVIAAHLGTDADGRRLIAPLRGARWWTRSARSAPPTSCASRAIPSSPSPRAATASCCTSSTWTRSPG